MDINTIITLLTALGVGSIIGYVVNFLLEKIKDNRDRINSIKEEKYRSILLQMKSVLDPNDQKYINFINKDGLFKDSEHYLNIVKINYYESILYSSDDLVRSLKKFIEEPNQKNFINVAKSMRKDLWGKKTKLEYSDLILK